MRFPFFLFLILITLACGNPPATDEAAAETTTAVTEPTYFELRTYYCYPDRLDALLTRFNDHTMALFEKHGMVNMGYWLPLDNADNKLVYLLGYPSRAARDSSWTAFAEDPEWQRVREASVADGPIVDSVTNWFLTYTDYSPPLRMEDNGPRIFSHRTYYTNPGKLADLNARFRDHTLDIFEKSGMTNIAYFDFDPEESLAGDAMTYLITFPDTTARRQSWESFIADPEWQAAYQASIVNGRLVDSITDELLVPTEFSPLK
jgi:hypothetical protein